MINGCAAYMGTFRLLIRYYLHGLLPSLPGGNATLCLHYSASLFWARQQ